MYARTFIAVGGLLLLAACDSGGTTEPTDDSEMAFQGIETGILRAIDLAFDGFNTSAGPGFDRTANGLQSGSITVAGQFDQGPAVNKAMEMAIQFLGYSDAGQIRFVTLPSQLMEFELQLQSIPDGTLNGIVKGPVEMTVSARQTGTLTLDLAINGEIQAGAGGTVRRVVGTTRILGSAHTSSGSYDVDIMR